MVIEPKKYVWTTRKTWKKKYKPIRNDCGGLDWGQFLSISEAEKLYPNRIWTVFEGDCGGKYCGSGRRRINALDYFITENPVEEGIYVEFELPKYTWTE